MPSGEGIDHILGANMKSDVRECGLLWDMAHVQRRKKVFLKKPCRRSKVKVCV